MNKPTFTRSLSRCLRPVWATLLLCASLFHAPISSAALDDQTLSLDGTIGLPIDAVELAGDFTIESWIYFTPGETINQRDGLVSGGGQQINFYQGKMRFYNGSGDVAVAQTAMTAGAWNHVAITRENGTFRIYVDGVLDATSTASYNGVFTVDHIGSAVASSTNKHLHGQLDATRIWTVARTQEEILASKDSTLDQESHVALQEALYYDADTNPAEGQVLSLDGQSALTLPTLTFAGDFTIESWVYLTEDEPVDSNDLLFSNADSSQKIDFGGGDTGGRIRFYDAAAGGDILSGETDVVPGSWVHVAITREGSTLSIYLNGKLDGAVRDLAADNTVGYTGTLTVETVGSGLHGQLDETRLWTVARNEQEITQSLSATIADPGSTTGLIAYYDYARQTDSILNDLAGGDHSAQLAAGIRLAPWSAPFGANAMSLAGEHGLSLETPIVLGANDDFTIASWIYFTPGEPINNHDALVSNSNGPQNINFWAGRMRLYDGANAPADVVIANTAISPGTWTHVAITRQSGTVRSYINGRLDATGATVYNGAFTIDRLASANVNDHLHGQLDQTSIWSKALSQQELQDSIGNLLAGGTLLDPAASGLIAYYDYETIVDNAAPDLVAANDASLPQVFEPGEDGQWGEVIAWPFVPISAATLPNGKILSWQGISQNTTYSIWDPVTETHLHDDEDVPAPIHNDHDMFCAHLVTLEDGRVLVNGGGANPGINLDRTSIFNHLDNTWAVADRMNNGRWYPTSVLMPDNSVFTLAGNGGGNHSEVWREGSGWLQQSGINIEEAIVNHDQYYDRVWWPLLTLAPNGRLFHFGPTPDMHWMDTEGVGNMEFIEQNPYAWSPTNSAGWYPKHGSLVMYDEGKLISAGGAIGGNRGSYSNTDFDGTLRASNRALLIDLNSPTPEIREIDPMFKARKFHNGVMAPNGEVMFFGGHERGLKFNDENSHYTVEIWTPPVPGDPEDAEQKGQWREGAPGSRPRNYHSVALLLTDGRVLNAGSTGAAWQENGQIYSPSYLFNPDGTLATRPVLDTAPASISVGEVFPVSGTPGLTKFSLIKLSATTHQINTDLRFLNVAFTEDTAGNYQLTAHGNRNVLTPGHWMLFGLNDQGTPSVSKVIHVKVATSAPPPSPIVVDVLPVNTQTGATSTFTASATGGSGALTYTWNFGDLSAPQEGASVTHTYTDPGLYAVSVTVTDAQGNETIKTIRQAVYNTPVDKQLSHSTGLALDAANQRLWSINPDNRSVSVLNTATNTLIGEVPLNGRPGSIALASGNSVWVTHADVAGEANSVAGISIIDRATMAVTATINLASGSKPYGIVFDDANNRALVTLEAGGKIIAIDGATQQTTESVSLGKDIRHLAYDENSGSVYVSRFITPPVPEESSIFTYADGVSGGELIVLNSDLSVPRTSILHHSNRQDSEHSARGVPNYLGAPVVSPDGLALWVPSKQDNILRGEARDGQWLTHDTTVRSIASYIDIASLTEVIDKRVDLDNASLASAASFGPFGNYLFVALETSREVAVVDAYDNSKELMRFSVGRAPQSLLVADQTLYVHNFMDRSIGIYDLSQLITEGLLEVSEVATIPVVGSERLAADIFQGKQLFYDAKDPRLALDGYMSCASCHNDAGQDGRVWDFTQFSEGLRNTISLEGHGEGQGRLHWSANFNEIHDFEGQIRAFAGGTGLMTDADFNTGTRSDPSGDPKAGISADLDALAAYMNSLVEFPNSPHRVNDQLSADAVAGQAAFAAYGCASCHSGAKLTDSANGTLHDIGTIGFDLGLALAGGVDTPTLLGLWATAPYLHDGSAATIADAIQAHFNLAVSPTDADLISQYLLELKEE